MLVRTHHRPQEPIVRSGPMPEVTTAEALQLLTRAVREQFGPDELLEIYNEVFPRDPRTQEEAHKDPQALIGRLVDHINGMVEMDYLVYLWRLIFVGHRDVWYNEEDERLHYNEGAEAVPAE
jgi:hypothetical protein